MSPRVLPHQPSQITHHPSRWNLDAPIPLAFVARNVRDASVVSDFLHRIGDDLRKSRMRRNLPDVPCVLEPLPHEVGLDKGDEPCDHFSFCLLQPCSWPAVTGKIQPRWPRRRQTQRCRQRQQIRARHRLRLKIRRRLRLERRPHHRLTHRRVNLGVSRALIE
jgi:hypothetical protein